MMPRLVAMMRTGERSLSKARFRKEKHSMSNMWTSSIKRTYGSEKMRKVNRDQERDLL